MKYWNWHEVKVKWKLFLVFVSLFCQDILQGLLFFYVHQNLLLTMRTVWTLFISKYLRKLLRCAIWQAENVSLAASQRFKKRGNVISPRRISCPRKMTCHWQLSLNISNTWAGLNCSNEDVLLSKRWDCKSTDIMTAVANDVYFHESLIFSCEKYYLFIIIYHRIILYLYLMVIASLRVYFFFYMFILNLVRKGKMTFLWSRM